MICIEKFIRWWHEWKWENVHHTRHGHGHRAQHKHTHIIAKVIMRKSLPVVVSDKASFDGRRPMVTYHVSPASFIIQFITVGPSKYRKWRFWLDWFCHAIQLLINGFARKQFETFLTNNQYSLALPSCKVQMVGNERSCKYMQFFCFLRAPSTFITFYLLPSTTFDRFSEFDPIFTEKKMILNWVLQVPMQEYTLFIFSFPKHLILVSSRPFASEIIISRDSLAPRNRN